VRIGMVRSIDSLVSGLKSLTWHVENGILDLDHVCLCTGHAMPKVRVVLHEATPALRHIHAQRVITRLDTAFSSNFLISAEILSTMYRFA
jgi:hypothetical protein